MIIMFTLVKTYENDKVSGAWLFDDETTSPQTIYIPFGLALALADSITFDDNDDGPYKLIGYIEVYFNYNNDIELSDGTEKVIIKKQDVMRFKDALWSMI